MSTVFISQFLPPDDSWESYGSARTVFHGLPNSDLVARVVEALVESDATEDYLLLYGSSVISATCLAVWFMLHDSCRVLVPSANGYVAHTIEMSTIQLQIERERDKLEKRKQEDRVVR